MVAVAVLAAAVFAFAGRASAADIMAGQDTVAGTVTVSQTTPGGDLTVAIDLHNWCMTQSQVAVANDPMFLPTTKKGNPIPGQFPYKTSYGDCVQQGTYTIPLSAIPGANTGTVYVAAHVDLFEASETTISAVSHAGETVYGPLEAYASYDSPLWAPFGKTAVVSPFASAGVWPALPAVFGGAQWITTAGTTELPTNTASPHYNTGLTDDSWRKAEVTLNVPAGSFVSSGELIRVTSDNAERVWLNGTMISTDGIMEGPGVDSLEWATISPAITFAPVVGNNTFSFVWRNYGSQMGLDLTPASNPNGLVYGVSINYHTPTNHGETGWAGGPGSLDFEGSNWATYFTYQLQQ